jgi:signal transduction histidine kinase
VHRQMPTKFKDLRTSSKLLLLCSMFSIAIATTTYVLVAEKLIAINFAQKELAGTRYLTTLRSVYAAILTGRDLPGSGKQGGLSPSAVLGDLAATQSRAAGSMDTSQLEDSLSVTLSELWSGKAEAPSINMLVPKALAQARALISRIADDSNLALDPDLDTYYLQNLAMNRLPLLLGQLGEVQSLFESPAAGAAPNTLNVRILVLSGLVDSTLDGIKSDINAAYRGNPGKAFKAAMDSDVSSLVSAATSYLESARQQLAGGAPVSSDDRDGSQRYSFAVDEAIGTWTAIQAELDHLLNQRISRLSLRLWGSLLLIAILVSLSILTAALTHRHITQPLERLEAVARKVRKRKDYSLRAKYVAEDEIGGLAAAFNDMMSELAAARERESAEQARIAGLQADLTRAARLTTMGEIAATIAHEINQPLTAIVTNASAGLRWIGNPSPNVEEAKAALARIVKDGHRASQVIASIRLMLKRNPRDKAQIDINDAVREVLAISHDELQSREIIVETALSPELPTVMADRVQIQQVFANLIMNATDAMSLIVDRPRTLRVVSANNDPASVTVCVEDSGPGIEEADRDRIFTPFYTTKSEGMGLGLSICRTIIEDHGGRLAAARGQAHGSIFTVTLPTGSAAA